MNVNDMTIGEFKELNKIFSNQEEKKEHPYVIGGNYLIRTVTFVYTGRLTWVGDMELKIEDAAWIADTGRFADSLKDFTNFDEVEPYPDGEVVIGRGSIIDAFQSSCTLGRSQK